MHEGDVKPFEDMTREELLEAARFWRSEYERMVRERGEYLDRQMEAAVRREKLDATLHALRQRY